MEPISSDFEFFDFQSVSDEEIQEIQTILKGPGSNGCVELPWEVPLKANSDHGDTTVKKGEKTDGKALSEIGTAATHFVTPQAPDPPLPAPSVEPFVTMPAAVRPYPTPHFFSQTFPYLRAYPPMGVPFLACAFPGATGEANPFGQFVPMLPLAPRQDTLKNESNLKNKDAGEHFDTQHKKKALGSDLRNSPQSGAENACQQTTTAEGPVTASVALTSVSADRPTSVPLVPLPPSTFAIAGGSLPLHGYPPGLHTLPFSQMSGPQAPSPAAMYYVPLFNPPYGGYVTPGGPVMLPVNLQPESEASLAEVSDSCADSVSPVVSPCKSTEDLNVQSDCSSPVECQKDADLPKDESADTTVKSSLASEEEVTDCNSSCDPHSKSVSSSPECEPDTVLADEEEDYKCQPAVVEEAKTSVCDGSRCWADLFKTKPEVNGIGSQPCAINRHNSNAQSTLTKKIVNGKAYTVPGRDSVH